MDKFFIRNKKTKEIVKEFNDYPNKDKNEELVGFNYNDFDIFLIVESGRPTIDANKEIVKLVEKFTTKISKDYPKVKLFEKTWEINSLPEDAVIEKLNQSLGEHLDGNYPFWEQNKHSGKALRYLSALIAGETPDISTTEYINDKVLVLADWCSGCRQERDKREKEFRENNIFPSFEWEERPIN